jgi:hypothetical protein
MELAIKSFNQLLDHTYGLSFGNDFFHLTVYCVNFTSELIQKHQVCVRVLGDVTLLPHDVQVAVARCVNLSRNNKRFVCVCDSRSQCLT